LTVTVDAAFHAPSGGKIELTMTGALNQNVSIPAWFTAPATLYADTYVDNGPQTFPSSCGQLPSFVGTSQGNQIVETLSTLDPVLGYTDTRTTTWYDVDNLGPVCVTIADVMNAYYDFSLDVGTILVSGTGKPYQTTTLAESLTIANPAPTVMSVRRAAPHALSPSVVFGRLGGIEHIRAVERAQRIEALVQYLRHSSTIRGGKR
jgi:hypothetical protein